MGAWCWVLVRFLLGSCYCLVRFLLAYCDDGVWIVPSSCCSGSNWANSTAPVEWQHEQEQDRAADAFEISPALVPGAGHDLDRAVIVLFRFQLGKFDRAGRMAA